MDSKFLHEQRKLSTTYQGNQRIVGFKWYFTMISLNPMHYYTMIRKSCHFLVIFCGVKARGFYLLLLLISTLNQLAFTRHYENINDFMTLKIASTIQL